ncbi:MAG TPA: hypothetical protein VHG93_10310 [Longimicrobium sp.]|nr:hypothetical protein [Longimicrobium sp.]
MTIFQNVTRGSFVQGSGILAIVAGSTGVHLTRWGMFGFVLTGIPLWCFGVVAAAGGVMFFLGPMMYGSASVAPAARSPGQPERMLFLYLRPFELDARNVLQLFVGASAGILAYANLLDGAWIPVAFLPVILNISKEQSFRDALSPLGDFIAFGRPGERLQPVGASRLYLEDGWKEEITGYMARARLVIVRPGNSRSIRWEVRQVLETVPPERILFYLRFRGWGRKKEQAYRAFRRSVRRHLGAELPERLGDERYLAFDAAGRPRFIREASRPSELVRQFFSRSGDVTTDRFRPVLQAVGLEPRVQANNLLDRLTHVFVWLGALFSITVVGGALLYLLFVLMIISYVFLLRLALAV